MKKVLVFCFLDFPEFCFIIISILFVTSCKKPIQSNTPKVEFKIISFATDTSQIRDIIALESGSLKGFSEFRIKHQYCWVAISNNQKFPVFLKGVHEVPRLIVPAFAKAFYPKTKQWDQFMEGEVYNPSYLRVSPNDSVKVLLGVYNFPDSLFVQFSYYTDSVSQYRRNRVLVNTLYVRRNETILSVIKSDSILAKYVEKKRMIF